MFRCAAPGYVSALYETAGLRDVAEWNVDVELVTRSPAQHWEMIRENVSLAVAALQQVDEPARERIAKAVIAKVSTYEEDGKVRIPGVARCIVGTKQGHPNWRSALAIRIASSAGVSVRAVTAMPGPDVLGPPLGCPARPHRGFFVLRGPSLSVRQNSERAATRRVASGGF